MTVPDPHDAFRASVPQTRRALREARERAQRDAEAAATMSLEVVDPTPTLPLPVLPERSAPAGTGPGAHPPIFKAPPPPLPEPAPLPLVPSMTDEIAPRHARRGHPLAKVALVAASLLLVGGTTAGAVASMTPAQHADRHVSAEADITASKLTQQMRDAASTSPSSAPVIDQTRPPAAADVAPASVDLCDQAAFTSALTAHDDVAAIRAAGGGARFRAALVDGAAPCVPMDDPTRLWIVVDKQRPLDPIDYAPAPRAIPAGVRSLDGAGLRTDAAAALSRMVKAAAHAGVGEIAMNSGYRSYATQHRNYGDQVAQRGVQGADLVSARPGYSEHQTGLATDVVACDPGCGTLDGLAATAQGRWIVAHAWEYGWVVRYEKGRTDITGYLPEPWHLRYIGTDLAKAYHDGGFHTLEQFFGLPAAPGYHD
ncbi:M15 family metallopeptidase [Microbacterium sp.]|uniref:M15 family metallopeptidase n=1 Tax=Microbacterium sp. TaxID=51671 RepID=UPI003A8E1EE4